MDLDLSNEFLKMEDLLKKEDIELLKKYGIDQHFFDSFSTGNISNADFCDLSYIVKKGKINGVINKTIAVDSDEELDIVRFSDHSIASGIVLFEIGMDASLSDARKILDKFHKQMDIDSDIIYILGEIPTDNEIKVTGIFFEF